MKFTCMLEILALPSRRQGLFRWRRDVGEKSPRDEVSGVVCPSNLTRAFAFFPPLVPCIYLYVVS